MKSLPILAALAMGTLSCAAHADENFLRKAGLWQITKNSADEPGPGPVSQLCLAADTDARLAQLNKSQMKSLCSKYDARRVGDAYVVDTICKTGSSQSTSHAVTKRNGDGAYRREDKIHFDRPMADGKSDAIEIEQGTRVGACPAGMKPGYLVIKLAANGPILNRMNLLKQSGSH